MKLIFRIIILCLLLIIISCIDNVLDKSKFNSSGPEELKVYPHKVPDDSISEPFTTIAGEPKIFQAGKPDTISIDLNSKPAGKPEYILQVVPVICTPGKDTFLLPQTFHAIDSPKIADMPRIVNVREPYSKEINPGNFSIYNQFDGLSSSISCMIQDNYGNIWLGTNDEGVIKFDGQTYTYFGDNIGLTNTMINSIYQDNKQNIWICSNDGIIRYDGYKYTRFSLKEGLPSKFIKCIYQDSKGDYWLGTYMGIVRFDGKSFLHYNAKQGFVGATVNGITEDKAGNLWFATLGKGILKFDRHSFYHYDKLSNEINKYINSLTCDKNGNLWFASHNGVLKFDGSNFLNYTVKEGLSSNFVNDVLSDHNGNIWFGTNNGICSFDGVKIITYTEKDGLSSNFVSSIIEDKNGNIWIGTLKGLSKFNGCIFIHYTGNEGIGSYISSIIRDKNDNMWFSTDKMGVLKYDGELFVKYSENEGLRNRINSVFEDKDGNIWIGYAGGVCKFDGNSFINYTDIEGLTSYDVIRIFQDNEGYMWFGTFGGGIIRFDGPLVDALSKGDKISPQANQNIKMINGKPVKTFTHYSIKQGLPNNFISSIIQDKHNNLWVGTYFGGVLKFEGSKFYHYNINGGFFSNRITSVVKDKENNLWFASLGSGVGKYNGATFTFYREEDGLLSNFVKSILITKNGSILFGTKHGLSKLTYMNVPINKQDSSGILFKSEEKVVEKSTFRFQNYTYDDGFLGINCNTGAISENNNGSVWVGTMNNLTKFNPEVDEFDTIPPNIQLTDISLFNEKISWVSLFQKPDTNMVLANGVKLKKASFKGVSRWYGLPQNLSLFHKNNFVTFRFIGITHHQSNKVKYQYKLDGVDKNWNLPVNENQATYANLRPRIYIFRVRAMSSNGLWSNELSYKFEIRPPWWQTLWFRLLLLFFIGFCLIGFYLLRITALKKQKRLLEINVQEKTKELILQKEELAAINEQLSKSNTTLQNHREELETMNEELSSSYHELNDKNMELESTLDTLKRTQKQLVQSEKMASLGILAAGVAHEINNPLNFIKGGIVGIEDYLHSHSKHPNQIYKLVDAIHEGVNRASAIVTSLNHYGSNENLPFTECKIQSVINNCLVMIQNQTKPFIEIRKEFEHCSTIIGNEGKLHQVFLNLLINAVQSIIEKGKITIRTWDDQAWLYVSIEDTGCGISNEDLPKIFDPFYTTKDPGEGTGLGLSIVYSIIEEHKGHIEVNSEHGIGTNVTVKLPVLKI